MSHTNIWYTLQTSPPNCSAPNCPNPAKHVLHSFEIHDDCNVLFPVVCNDPPEEDVYLEAGNPRACLDMQDNLSLFLCADHFGQVMKISNSSDNGRE